MGGNQMVEMSTGKYHYGLTIREYRKECGMTQAELAELWPKSERFGGGEGVNWRYVQDIEHGRKRLEDVQTLRRLCEILHIPYWKCGLSDYDPFSAQTLPGQGKSMYAETLSAIEYLIQQIWSLRSAARLTEAQRGIAKLGELMAYFQRELPPPGRLEQRFQVLSVQYLRLQAATLLEQKNYPGAMALYQHIFESAKSINEPGIKALALKGIGKELERKGEKQEAVAYLEEARDASLEASKLLRAFIHSYLIRGYAGSRDALRFERAVATGLTLARSLPAMEDGTDFVYSWSPVSSILAEQSGGYLELGQPKKTLAIREELLREIHQGQDMRVLAWIPLDWARAYRMIGDIEQCIEEARVFYQRSMIMQSPHALHQVQKLLAELERDGYSEHPAVRNLKEEVQL
jgi:tetratricopeptide (TPR) repeat protein